jgi:valyl-tRNA synthetase
MKALAKPALDAVNSDEVKFFPEKYKNMYRHWMENIRDWCISRQLWWGQRIPAFYIGEGEDEKVFVASTKEAALELARKELGETVTADDLRQDEDVVDTWFSSWLWPITVFDGFENEKEFNYYYPTSVLVTGWDIIFLWVARMIMAGYEWKNLRPFDHVYFTGMVRDKKGRKMSKSLGNSPDALKLIEDFGADGVRFGILSSSPAGGDLLFDEKMCEQGRNFCNKIWNALRLVKGWEVDENLPQDERSAFAVRWIESRFSAEVVDQENKFGKYRLSDALMSLYTLIRGDFCSWYLEMIKPDYGKPIDRATYDKTIGYFRQICSMLHPFMPFITEEVWHQLKPEDAADDCIVSAYPKASQTDMALLSQVAGLEELVTKVRELRNANQVAQSKAVDLYIGEGELLSISDLEPLHVVCKLANIEHAASASEMPEDAIPFVAAKQKFFAVLPIERNLDEERERLNKELEYYKGFVQTVMKKLGNERFVQNAPEAVVDKERKKLADGQEKIRMIEDSLAHLEG